MDDVVIARNEPLDDRGAWPHRRRDWRVAATTSRFSSGAMSRPGLDGAAGPSGLVDSNEPRAEIFDRAGAEATFEPVAIDRGRGGGRRLVVAVAAAALVAVVSINLLPASEEIADPSQSNTPRHDPTPFRDPNAPPAQGLVGPGAYEFPVWSQDRIRAISAVVPDGWASMDAGTTLYKDDPNGPSAVLRLHPEVHRVVTDVCAAKRVLADVGPTVDDLAKALSEQTGAARSGPTDVTLGGYQARRFVLALPPSCPEPAERVMIWQSETVRAFVPLQGATATIIIVDVNGDRVVFTSQCRGCSASDDVELEKIIASIRIVADAFLPTAHPLNADLPVGKIWANVEGVRFSFDMPTSGWEPHLGFFISKSFVGAQDAEAIIFWTSFPDARLSHPCDRVLGGSVGPSVADLAGTIASVPGTDAVGPSDATVGERPAKHVVLTVDQDAGCDPGFFYAWEPLMGGAIWADTLEGDTIRVWIVEVNGRRFFIEAETHKDMGPPVHQDLGSRVEAEIQQIVDSIRFPAPAVGG